MDTGTRLSAERLIALAPGDAVTIESGAELGRIRRTPGIVTRVTDTKAFVRLTSARGVPYVQEFSLRTGWRTGRGHNAALVEGPSSDNADARRRQQSIDALWRAWARNRADVAALRSLHAALGERLHELQSPT